MKRPHAGVNPLFDLRRRGFLRLLTCGLPAFGLTRAWASESAAPEILPGPFSGTRASLAAYHCPEWFRSAKLGIWAHWGPQSAAEYGDWYARNIYIEGGRQYRYHVEHYGHPSKFGYKDLIPTWKGDLFDADHLVGLYKQAGARYFVSMGVHVDNFDLWNSRHTRWNAVNMGPRQDIVGHFRQAASRHGLRFGVSDHLWMAYKWMSVSRGADKQGPLAGVPYDGIDPAYADLYGDCPRVYRELPWDEDGIPESWKRHWFARIKDLVDQYEPDFLYCDGQIPFQEWGLSLVAHLYNQSAHRNGGAVEAVYTSKRREDSERGTCVYDMERGVVEGIWPSPWQTDTCIGNWHYDRAVQYKSAKRVIDMLLDVVSRNGCLLLNFPLTSRGVLDDEEQRILAELTAWMRVNSEGIHDTRPWHTFGEGPGIVKPDPKQRHKEDSRKDLTAADVRFTTKGKALFAFVMGWPEGELTVAPLGRQRTRGQGRIGHVALIGFKGRLRWKQDDSGLKVSLPAERPCAHAFALRIEGLET